MSSIKLADVCWVFAGGFDTKQTQFQSGSEAGLSVDIMGWGCFSFCGQVYTSFKVLSTILYIYGIGISDDIKQPSENAL